MTIELHVRKRFPGCSPGSTTSTHCCSARPTTASGYAAPPPPMPPWAGWSAALASETATAATYLSDEAVNELFGDEQCPLVAGQSTVFARSTP